MSDAQHEAIRAVLAERKNQDATWGEQNHDAGIWALILLEEVGEWARAELHARFGGPDAGTARAEIVQVAAVAVAMQECMLRHGAPEIGREEDPPPTILVEGAESKVVEHLGWQSASGNYIAIAIDQGKERAAIRYPGQPWRWRIKEQEGGRP